MRILTLIFTFMLALPAMALFGGDGESAKDSAILEGKTVLYLQESAHKKVAQDRLRATLRIEHEAKTPKEVQEYINRKMSGALNKARRIDTIEAETQSYQVYKREHWEEEPEIYINNGKKKKKRITRWHGSQTLQLEATKPESLLKLTGELQEHEFAVNNLSYYLSREKSDTYRDELVGKALARIKHRAQLIGNQLGTPTVHIAEINFGGSQPARQYKRAYAMAAMAESAGEDMAAPVAEAGNSEINITVRTTVYLSK